MNNMLFNKKTKAEYILTAIFFLYFIFFSFLSIMLFKTHHTRGDLTSYEQAIWNTTQGRLMQSTFIYSIHGFWDLKAGSEVKIADNASLLGIHFSLINLLIVPIYKIFPKTETILILQTLVITLGIFPLYKLVAQKLRSKLLGIIFSLSYLLHPGIIATNLFEFHPDAFTATLFLFIFYFLEKKKYLLLFTFCFLASVCKENVSLAISGLGLLLLFKKEKKLGLSLFILGLVYFFLAIYVFIPRFSPTGSYPHGGIYGSSLGGSLFEIAKNSLTKPYLFIKTFFTIENILYILKLNFPVFFLAFLSPLWFLLSIWGILPNLLTSNIALKLLLMHYDVLAIPFIYIGAIEAIKKIKRKKIFIGIILLSSITANILFSRYPIQRAFGLRELKNNLDHKAINKLASFIPPTASVSTQDYISGDLVKRKKLYLFPVYYNKVDYIFIAEKIYVWPFSNEEQQAYIQKINNNPRYELFIKEDNYLLYRRKE